MVWKRKRSGSTKPEGVYYTSIRTLQTFLPSKPEPIYIEMNNEQNNISITNPIKQLFLTQDNPTYSNPKQPIKLQDNPAYSDPTEQIKLQDNLAYGRTSKH